MLKTYREFLNERLAVRIDEDENNKTAVKYRWREPYNNIWHESRCEVLSHNDKTAKIRLLEFGKNNARPGTVMTVHLKSLVGFTVEKPGQPPDDSWKRYSYFD